MVSRSQTKAWPQVLRHGWMDAPLFFCPQTSKDLLGWGVPGEFLWRIRTGLAGRREEQEKELIVIEANLPGGARGRNETTATERRAGSMVRIRWAPGDRGEAPASSRFQNESLGLSKGDRERERDGEGAKRPCGDAVRASRPSRDERTTSITSSFLADASLASRRALRRSRTTKIQTTRPI